MNKAKRIYGNNDYLPKLKIERNIPLGGRDDINDVLLQLKKNESVLVTKKTDKAVKSRLSVRLASLHKKHKTQGIKFAYRGVKEGVRVWRIK